MTRIETVCSLIKKCGVFADIGCDHGLVSEYVAKNGLAEDVFACDVSADCVKKAEKLLSPYENAHTLVGDGFAPLEKAGVTVDEAVICGMGGELIIKILEKCPYKPNLILGGQKNADKLRVYLVTHGYKITFDKKIEERGKYYDIMRAESGQMQIDEFQAMFGVYYREKNVDLLRYFEWISCKLRGYKQTEKNVGLLKKITEAEKWQR